MGNNDLSNLLSEYGFSKTDIDFVLTKLENIKSNINSFKKDKHLTIELNIKRANEFNYVDIELYQPEKIYQSATFVLIWLKQFHFDNSKIVRIVKSQPSILTINTLVLYERIDSLSQLFEITHDNIHQLITACPTLLLLPKQDISDRFNSLVK